MVFDVSDYRLPCDLSCKDIGITCRNSETPIVDMSLFREHVKGGCVSCQLKLNEIEALRDKKPRSSPIECDS